MGENRKYIGSSVDMDRRWAQHRRQLNRMEHGNSALQYAWTRFRDFMFAFETLEECPIAELYEREQHWIDRTPLLFNARRNADPRDTVRTRRYNISEVAYMNQKTLKNDAELFHDWAEVEIRAEWRALKKPISHPVDSALSHRILIEFRAAIKRRAMELRARQVGY